MFLSIFPCQPLSLFFLSSFFFVVSARLVAYVPPISPLFFRRQWRATERGPDVTALASETSSSSVVQVENALGGFMTRNNPTRSNARARAHYGGHRCGGTDFLILESSRKKALIRPGRDGLDL